MALLEKTENWFLNCFIPRFMFLNQYIGLLAIYYWIALFFQFVWNIEWIYVFQFLLVFGAILKYQTENHRRLRIIKRLVKLDYDADSILQTLYNDGIVSSEFDKHYYYSEIKGVILHKKISCLRKDKAPNA